MNPFRLSRSLALVGLLGVLSSPAFAATVYWTDWLSGTAGTNGTAVGKIDTGTEIIDVVYTGEIAFLQTSGGTNYFNPSGPYISAAVDNAPGSSDIIALSSTSLKTLTFSKAVDNLFFAVVSLNSNGYVFDSEFVVESFGQGYWGNGTLGITDLGNGHWRTSGSGEPHGVLRFTDAVTSISWTSQANEYWNGFTVGTYGVAPPPVNGVPDGGATVLLIGGTLGAMVAVRRRK